MMTSDTLDLPAYLVRLSYTGPVDTSVETLHALQAAHIAAIPFEAIDVLFGDGINLDPTVIEDKLVRRGRGGYCYEHNGLYSRVLERLGFAVKARIARVLWGGVGEGGFQPRTHMALQVEAAGETWLVDVGFGSAVPTAPLRWDDSDPQNTSLGCYRLIPTAFGRRLEVRSENGWKMLYEVLDELPQQEDFEVSNWFTSTHPDSPFRHNLIVTHADGKGRVILSGSELTVRAPEGQVFKKKLDIEQLELVLRDIFNLHLDPARLRPILAELAWRKSVG